MTTQRKFVFICGPHRSGTSILHDVLRNQGEISGFMNTGVAEDEGQHLQSVFAPARIYGGPGKFGFDPQAAMTETHPSVTDQNRERLFQEWSRYWDLTKPILIEKSPPNIIRTRFLQAMFPNSYFIMLTRNPIAVSYATQKMAKTSLTQLLKHWITVHEIFEQDKPHLTHLCMLSYEELIHAPNETLDRIGRFLGIPVHPSSPLSDHNQKYFQRWLSPDILNMLHRRRLEYLFENRIRHYGYSLRDVTHHPLFD